VNEAHLRAIQAILGSILSILKYKDAMQPKENLKIKVIKHPGEGFSQTTVSLKECITNIVSIP
jgi:hypothetical protein